MSTSRRNRSKINEKEGFEGGNGGVVGKGLQPEDVDSYERMKNGAQAGKSSEPQTHRSHLKRSHEEKTLESRIKEKKKELQNLEDGVSKKKKDLKESEGLLSDLKTSIEARQRLLNELRDIGENADEGSKNRFYFKMSQMEEEIQVRDRQISTHLDKIKQLEHLLITNKEQKAKIKELEQSLEEKEERIEELENENEKFEGELEEFEGVKAELEEKVEALEEDNRKFEERIEDLKQREEELNHQIEVINQEHEEEKKTPEEEDVNEDEKNEKEDDYLGEPENEKKHKSVDGETKDEVEGEQVTTEENLEDVEKIEEREGVEEEVPEKNESGEEKDVENAEIALIEKYEALLKERDDLIEELRKKIALLEQDKSLLSSEIKDEKDLNSELTNENGLLKSRISELESILERIKKNEDLLKTELKSQREVQVKLNNDYQSQNKALSQRIIQLESNLKQTKSSLEKTEKQIKDGNNTILDALNKEKEFRDMKIDKTPFITSAGSNAGDNDFIKLFLNEYKKLVKQLEEAKSVNNNLQKKLREKDSKLEKALKALRNAMNELARLKDTVKDDMEAIKDISNSELKLQKKIREKNRLIEKLQEETLVMGETIEERIYKLKKANERIEKLEATLVRTESQGRSKDDLIAKLREEKKDLSLETKKARIDVEEKTKDVKRLEDVIVTERNLNRKMRISVNKAEKMKEKARQMMFRANEKVRDAQAEKEEFRMKFEAINTKYGKYKENLSRKDTWIIKQGDEIIKLKNYITKLKKIFGDYKNRVEEGYDQGLNEKNTEIMVLKEMVRSTKALLRAKDVDIQRLKRKVNISSAVRLSHENPLFRRPGRDGYPPQRSRRNQQRFSSGKKKMISFNEYKSRSRPNSYFKKKDMGQFLLEKEWVKKRGAELQGRPKSFFQPKTKIRDLVRSIDKGDQIVGPMRDLKDFEALVNDSESAIDDSEEYLKLEGVPKGGRGGEESSHMVLHSVNDNFNEQEDKSGQGEEEKMPSDPQSRRKRLAKSKTYNQGDGNILGLKDSSEEEEREEEGTSVPDNSDSLPTFPNRSQRNGGYLNTEKMPKKDVESFQSEDKDYRYGKKDYRT